MALAWGDGAWGDNAWGGGETFPVSVTETALIADSPAAGLLIDVSISSWPSETFKLIAKKSSGREDYIQYFLSHPPFTS